MVGVIDNVAFESSSSALHESKPSLAMPLCNFMSVCEISCPMLGLQAPVVKDHRFLISSVRCGRTCNATKTCNSVHWLILLCHYRLFFCRVNACRVLLALSGISSVACPFSRRVDSFKILEQKDYSSPWSCVRIPEKQIHVSDAGKCVRYRCLSFTAMKIIRKALNNDQFVGEFYWISQF